MAKGNNWELGRETRYFNGTLRKLRQERGWLQADLAKMLGVSSCQVSVWETLKQVPDRDTYGKKLEEIFGKPYDEIFPEFLIMFNANRSRQVEYAELTPQLLSEHIEKQRLLSDNNDDPEKTTARHIVEAQLKEALSGLSDREQKIISMRFGLNGEGLHTLEEVANEFSVNRERIRQIEAKALSKLRKQPIMRAIRGNAAVAYGGFEEVGKKYACERSPRLAIRSYQK